MISFENNNKLHYIDGRISLPIVENSNIIISCKTKWGMLNSNEIQSILLSYKKIKKKVYVFLVSDNSEVFNIPNNVILYRTSLYKSKKKYNEHILPYVWECNNDNIDPLPKTEKPIVGFCGWNSIYRHKTIETIKNNINIESNFILRDKFWGGKPHDQKLIEDFRNNMINSHFNICNRGNGNFSMRFYETLSFGRIPIIIDTDILLPFENLIDWYNIIIIVKKEEELNERILNYYHNNNIIIMQKKCREIYDNYFRGSNFFDRIIW